MSTLLAQWSVDVPQGQQIHTTTTSFPPQQGQVSIEVKLGNLADLADGLERAQGQINEVLTQWKDALGNEGGVKEVRPSQNDAVEDEDEGEELSDASDDREP